MMNSDFAALSDGHAALKAQVTEVVATQREQTRMTMVMRAELAANTEITADVRELLLAGKLGLKVLGWIGTGAKWVASIAAGIGAVLALWHTFKGGGKP